MTGTLLAFICPECGVLVDVESLRPGQRLNACCVRTLGELNAQG